MGECAGQGPRRDSAGKVVGCRAWSVHVYNSRSYRDQALGQTRGVRGEGAGPAFKEPGGTQREPWAQVFLEEKGSWGGIPGD